MKRTRKITIIEEVEVTPSAPPPRGRVHSALGVLVRLGAFLAAYFHGGH